jgi:hypothetical protein
MDLVEQTQDILKKCVVNILRSYGLHTNDKIEAIVTNSLEKIEGLIKLSDENEMYGGMGIGTCCYCGDECNPQSQQCGSCARGLSGAAIGLPVPGHLHTFI